MRPLAPDWYADPTRRHEHRYWDGSKWTEHVSDRGQSSTDPLPANPPLAGQQGSRLPLTAKSIGGVVTVDDTWVTIQRKGVLAKATQGWTKGEKRIPIMSITAVEFKKPGATNGYIRFTVPGVIERARTRGAFDASDENAVMFSRSALNAFSAIRDHVERVIAEGATPTPASPGPAMADVPDQLREFAKLRDEGILTAEEFEAQKAKLLER